MFKNEMLQTIVELKKKGVYVYLTEEGFKQFVKLMTEDEFEEFKRQVG